MIIPGIAGILSKYDEVFLKFFQICYLHFMSCVLLYLYNFLIPYSLFCRRVDFGLGICMPRQDGALFFTIMHATCSDLILLLRYLHKKAGCNLTFTIDGAAAPHLLPLIYCLLPSENPVTDLILKEELRRHKIK